MKPFYFLLCAVILWSSCSDGRDEVVWMPKKEKNEFNVTFRLINEDESNEAKEYGLNLGFHADVYQLPYYSRRQFLSNHLINTHGRDTLEMFSDENSVGNKYVIRLSVTERWVDGWWYEDIYHKRLYESEVLFIDSKTDTLITIRYPQDTLTTLRRHYY